ncbi:trigger factor-like [Acanthochromis polyacanthus]|uniref:trigger factor-like n=1 Tax=Acanthochromis polyacanthus TaxID=80966 RepID=UPI0022348E27|nr:trigger factor-like [Acanthochromis polyacanthus]
MIKVESNPNNSKYEADIEFITKKEWEDEVWLMKQFHDNNTDQEHEEDQEDDDDDDDKEDDDDEDDEDDEDDDDDDDDDDDKMSAVYGDGWKDKISENLMDKKYFQAIPEFLESKKKTLTCDSVR